MLNEFDPGNLLLEQARREVLNQQLDVQRLHATLEQLGAMTRHVIVTPRLTPFAFPIWADHLRTQVSSEDWTDRVQRMLNRLEDEALAPAGDTDARDP